MSLGLLASCAAIAAFVAAMVFLAVRDVATMTISNRVLVVLLFAFAVLAPLAGWPLDRIGVSLLVALVTFLGTAALFAFGWIGGGDGKLMTVSVLWIGAGQALNLIVYTLIAGGLFGLGLLLFRLMPLPGALQRQAWITRLHAPGTGIPYAVAIAAGGLAVLPETYWMKNFG